ARGVPRAAHRAPVRDVLLEVLLLGVRRRVAPLDAAARPRRPDDGDVLEVPGPALARKLPRHGGLDGRLPEGRPLRAAGALSPHRGARARLPLAGRVPPPPRRRAAGGAVL